ncbi:MAG: hypothetical protein J1F01_02455 [Oscillospiraceae bacterium]|nr:hypothetical protein [Oscillospiraceae bacterium]
MDNVRIASYAENFENFKATIDSQIVGFTKVFSQSAQGDTVYISLRFADKHSYCCARATVGSRTDDSPWDNGDNYPLRHKLTNIEFCKPFLLKVLADAPAGRNWGCKYMQTSKIIKDVEAISILAKNFNDNKTKKMFVDPSVMVDYSLINVDGSINTDVEKIEDDEKIDVMCTFQTVKFKNETDKNLGLETLVNRNFYELFNFFTKENSILIDKNRLFKTKSGTPITGIPDALLITFDVDNKKTPLKIYIIEYECYGENKTRATDKFNYLNGHIIPQLIRFASTFSVATDSQIRDQTINLWLDKIIAYIKKDDRRDAKIQSWLKSIDPDFKVSSALYTLRQLLDDSFHSNIKILLIIDELTGEQHETIKNVIQSFKLSEKTKSSSIDFAGYVVRLEQLLTYTDLGKLNETGQYALSLQE